MLSTMIDIVHNYKSNAQQWELALLIGATGKSSRKCAIHQSSHDWASSRSDSEKWEEWAKRCWSMIFIETFFLFFLFVWFDDGLISLHLSIIQTLLTFLMWVNEGQCGIIWIFDLIFDFWYLIWIFDCNDCRFNSLNRLWGIHSMMSLISLLMARAIRFWTETPKLWHILTVKTRILTL